MGKGDKKSKRGKISMGSFGKNRPHKVSKTTAEKVKEEKTQTKSA